MGTYLVSYDLSKPHRGYEELETYLRSNPDWARVLQSVWFVQTQLTARALAEEVARRVDSDDHFVVTPLFTPVGQYSVWYNLDPQVDAWLKRPNAA